jgi:CBS domain-containing protein
MTITCPFCGAEVLPGADLCDDCQHSLTDVGVHEPDSAVEKGLLTDRISSLDPNTPVSVSPETTIGQVLEMMVSQNIGCVMVVRDDKLLGIFSERDVLMRVNVEAAAMSDRPISTIMTPNPESLQATDKIAFALHRMNVGGYRHIPILDGHQLTGVISIRDILGYLTQHVEN